MTETVRLGARLRAARKAAGFKTSKEFLKKHKVPASTYSQHESGARHPDDETIQFYSKVFGVNFNWLQTGKGNPYKSVSIDKKSIMQEELIDLKKPAINSHNHNQQLLATILEKVFKSYELKLSTYMLKKIAATTIIEYIKAQIKF